MATLNVYFDTRKLVNGLAPIKFRISHKNGTALISLGIHILPSQWDDRYKKVIGHPQRNMYNQFINQRKNEYESVIFKLSSDGLINKMTAQGIKEYIMSADDTEQAPLFSEHFLKFANAKKESTREIYMHTYKCIGKYEKNIQTLKFEDITKEWLIGFDTFMSVTSPSKNARNIHLRNIRAVFNDAIDDELTTFYPFRKFKIKSVETAKRSLSVEQLRALFNIEAEEYARKYLDMFKLIFFLIGINVVDLCRLKEVNNGRIEYRRAKTNKLYSIKVEPEAMAIINQYKGKNQLLNIMDSYTNYKDYRHRLNENLQLIGEVSRSGRGGKKQYNPLFPKLTTYWARHTWATIAAELEIPKETISAALGHEIGSRVTSIYIDFDKKKIDEANRKVIDWVLYNKR